MRRKPDGQPAAAGREGGGGDPASQADPEPHIGESDAVYYLAAAAIGAVVGLFGSALHFGVERILVWPQLLKENLAASLATTAFLAGLVAAAMVILSVWLVRRFAPEAAGSGVQEVEGAMEGLRRIQWRQVLAVKSVGSFLSLGSGMVLGREGPTIHIGASIAQAFREWLHLSERDGRGLLGSGAAAGLAAAFGAPLASILFVIEETRRQFPYSLKTYTAVMLASVTSGIVTIAVAGPRPFMALGATEVPDVWLAAFVGLGIVLGLFGLVFNRCVVWSLDLSLAIGRHSSFYVVPAVVGFAIGVLLVIRPDAAMGGDNLALRLISQSLPFSTMAMIAVARFVMTMASYSSGGPGGIFAPILSLATVMGLLYSLVLAFFLEVPAGVTTAFAVAAMGGFFSATVRAPLVGVVLILELTGAYSNLIPTILTCLFANLVASLVGNRPIYEVLLERTLALSGDRQPSKTTGTTSRSPQIGGWDQR